MYTGIFDSHAHYDDARFDDDREELLQRLHSEGIVHIMNIGADPQTSAMSVRLAESYDFIYSTVGAHPGCVDALQDGYLNELERLATGCPKVCAIGEIGLDYYNDEGNVELRELQKKVFRQQLELADRLGLPVVIHDRDAHADVMEILREYRPRGVVHCYSGSAEMARQLVDMGMYIGFTGVVTFKNARRAIEAVEEVPLERLLIETDCPYLAPEPFRGKRCDSLMLTYVVDRIAQVKGVGPQEIVACTAANACALYGIS